MKNTCIMCGSANIISTKSQFYPFLIERMFKNEPKQTDIVHCLDCDVYYASYRPSTGELSRLYTGYRDDNYQAQREKYESWYTKEFNKSLGFSNDNRQIRNKMMIDITGKYFDCRDIKTILDYGGDSGQYIPNKYVNAEKFVYDISGVEPVEGVAAIDQEQLNSKKWDLVMCCHVLEHDSNPMNIVNDINSLMDVGSYLYIELPYEDYVDDMNSGISIHEHINFFRIKTLETIFASLDFVILENSLVRVADVSGRVFGQHICCLVKKVKNDDNTLLLKQVARVKNELVNIIEQRSEELATATKDINSMLLQQGTQLRTQNEQLRAHSEQLRMQNEQLQKNKDELIQNNMEINLSNLALTQEVLSLKGLIVQQKKYKRRYRLSLIAMLVLFLLLLFMKID